MAYQNLGRVASVRVRRKRCWWAFTFPLGAYTASTLALGRAWNSSLLASFTVLLFVSLCNPWIVVTFGTLCAIHSGEIWRR